MRHGRYTVAIRTKTILEVKQLKEKAENVNHKPISHESISTFPPGGIHISEPAVPQVPKLDNFLPLESLSNTAHSLDISASPAAPGSLGSSSFSIPSISSQTTETSIDFTSPSPADNFMTLSSPQLQMDALADSDITSLFDDLSPHYLDSGEQHLELKMEDLADSLLDQPETSVDFLEDITLPDEPLVNDVTNYPSGMF